MRVMMTKKEAVIIDIIDWFKINDYKVVKLKHKRYRFEKERKIYNTEFISEGQNTLGLTLKEHKIRAEETRMMIMNFCEKDKCTTQ